MDLKTCLKKMQLVGVLAFASVDEEGNPQVRNISAIHYEEDAIYFYTARGKSFCRELLANGKLQILCYTRFKEMIRLSTNVKVAKKEEQIKWREKIFEEQPYLTNVYPGKSKDIGIIFEIKDADIEYFNLGVRPIYRDNYVLGKGKIKEKGYTITNKCISCGKCKANCPQQCIKEDTPYKITQVNCLHCGYCFENCPVHAIIPRSA